MSSIIEGYNYDIFISYRQKKKERENGGRGEKKPCFAWQISQHCSTQPEAESGNNA